MKKLIIILWVITLVTAIFVGLTQRYSIVAAGKEFPFAYKLDKLTGKVWFVRTDKEQVLLPIK